MAADRPVALEVGELGAMLASRAKVSLRWGQGTQGMAQDPGVSCTPLFLDWGPRGHRQWWNRAGAVLWWQSELQGQPEGSLLHHGGWCQGAMSPFQLSTLESNDDSVGTVLHSFGETLVDLRGLVVPPGPAPLAVPGAEVLLLALLSVHGWDVHIFPCLSFPALKSRWREHFLAWQGPVDLSKSCISPQWDGCCSDTEQGVGPVLGTGVTGW